MKIAIFENEYEQVRTSFELVNELFFENSLKYDVFVSSQDFGDFKNIIQYSLILIDIDLSLKSELDGYSLIKEILKIKTNAKIIILTGASRVSEKLKELKMPNYPILLKPLSYQNIYDEFKKILPPKIEK